MIEHAYRVFLIPENATIPMAMNDPHIIAIVDQDHFPTINNIYYLTEEGDYGKPPTELGTYLVLSVVMQCDHTGNRICQPFKYYAVVRSLEEDER